MPFREKDFFPLQINAVMISFIGLSLPAPAPEWGSMLSSARVDMLRAPTLVLFPALAIVLTAFSVNLLGDGLRDAMDPRLKS